MNKINSNQVSSLFLQSLYGNGYNTTTIQLSLITYMKNIVIQVLCDNIKKLLSSACTSSLLVYFMGNTQLSKLQKLKEYRMM